MQEMAAIGSNFGANQQAVVPARSAAEIQIELEEKLTSLLGTPITLG